jgi:exodeoxyribonuclease VIII
MIDANFNRRVHVGMAADDYHRHPAVSKSMLDRIARSPLHLQAYLRDPDMPEETPAMRLGTAVHAAVLEPERFARQYAAFGGDKRTNAGKAAFAELEARGAIVLKSEEFDQVCEIARAVRQHDLAADLLANGVAEASAFWHDEATGVECRCRPDWWRNDGIVVDLKTTNDASPEAFARSVVNYRYHVQAAHYLAGTEADRFVFVVIEKEAPYAIAIYELDAAALALGRELRARDLTTYATCAEFDHWPGFPASVQTLTLPAWAGRGAA